MDIAFHYSRRCATEQCRFRGEYRPCRCSAPFSPTARGQRRNNNSADQSKVVVLSTHHEDTRLDLLRCGEALSALLLECTMAGLATCTLTHMTELAPSRQVIHELTGQHGLPQLLVRVGQAPVEDRSPSPQQRVGR